MNGMNMLALLVITSLACRVQPAPSSDDTAFATASANPVGSMISNAEHATPTVSLEQDTAKTVTRRVWADADLHSVSPDGRYVSLTDWTTRDLAIRDLETGEMRRLTHNNSAPNRGLAETSKISRDGRWVAYGWYDNARPDNYKLGVVDIEGTNPRLIYRDPSTDWIDPHDWSPDGRFVLVYRAVDDNDEIVLISAENGSARVLKTLKGSSPGSYPLTMTFSPDGRYIAYDYPQEENSQDRDIFVLSVAGGPERTLIQHTANDYLLGWAPDGDHILFASDRSGTPGAWLLPVADGKPSGSPWLVTPDMWRAVPVGFTADGRYFYSVRTGSVDVYIATFDPEARTVIGSPTVVTSRSLGDHNAPHWSPDGRHLVYVTERGPAGARLTAAATRTVVIRSFETGEVRELSLRISGMPIRARWRPDGRTLVVLGWNPSDAENRVKLYLVDVQTSSTRVLMRAGQDRPLGDAALSPDARSAFYEIAMENPAGQTASRIVREDLETGDTTSIFETPYGGSHQVRHMALSPDGETLAFGYWPKGGPNRLVLLPAIGGEPREFAANVQSLAWMPDGQTLLFQQFVEGWEAEVWYVNVSEGEPERIGLTTRGPRWGLDVHPDGRRIAYTSGVASGELWVMENFLPQPRR